MFMRYCEIKQNLYLFYKKEYFIKYFRPTSFFMLIFIIFLSVFSVSCSKNKKIRKDSHSISQQEQKKEIWTCPMHPQIRMSAPGKCPICGMDLVRASTLSESEKLPEIQNLDDANPKRELPEGHAPFYLSSKRIQMIGVKYGVVEKRELFKSIEAPGRVAFDPELFTAQNEYVEAMRQLDRVKDSPISDVKHSAKRMVEASKLRLKILGLSDQQILSLRSTSGQTTNLLFTSPGDDVWIYVELFEMDLPHVDPGQQVKISGGSLVNRELFGRVESVDRVINSQTRTAKVRVLVPHAKSYFRPEAYVNASIFSSLGEQIVIPFDAVLDSGKEMWVFVVKKDGYFEPRKVNLKHRAGDNLAIESGLEVGEKIVTSANFLIDSESRLKGVLLQQSSDGNQDQNKLPKTGKEVTPKAPECPKGQKWHEQMKHCMPTVSGG